MLTREHDAVIAKELFGWKNVNPTVRWDRYTYGDPGDVWTQIEAEWCRGLGFSPSSSFLSPFPLFHRDDTAALSVVMQLYRKEHWPVSLTLVERNRLPIWRCEIQAINGHTHLTHHESLAHAICIATLKVLGRI